MVYSRRRAAPYMLKQRDGLDTSRSGSVYDDIWVFMQQNKSGSWQSKQQPKYSAACDLTEEKCNQL